MKRTFTLLFLFMMISLIRGQTGISTFPHTESFDSETFPPAEWLNLPSLDPVPGTWSRETSSTNPTCTPHSGIAMAKYNSSEVYQTHGCLVSPPLHIPAGVLYQARFWMYRDDGHPTLFDQLIVRINDAPTPENSLHYTTIFRPYDPGTTPNQWYEYTMGFMLEQGENFPLYLIFDGLGFMGGNIYIDDITFEEVPPAPLFSVNGNWTFENVNINTSVTRQYSITNHGNALGDVLSLTLEGDYFTLLSNPTPCTLDPDESVFFNIRYNPTALGDHIGTVTITYALPQIYVQELNLTGNCVDPPIIINSFPWTETFESGVFPPAGWTYYDLDGVGTSWGASNDFNHTPGGNTSALHASSIEAPAQEGGQSGWLVSPPIIITSWTLLLDYWSFNMNPQNYQQNAIYISTGSPDPALGNYMQVHSPETIAAEWVHNQFAQLYNYEYQTIYIAFEYGGYDADNWYLDDITIAEPITSTIEITHLPLLNNLRTDISHRVSAEIVCSGYPFDFATLSYSVNGSSFNELTMQNYNGDIYYADIPPQALNSQVQYYLQAWNTEGISSGTDAYSFMIEDPTWLRYSNSSPTDYIAPSLPYAAYNVYSNPLFGSGISLAIYQTEGEMLNNTTATLEIYAYDGISPETLVYSQQVSFVAQERMIFDFTEQNVSIDTQFLIIKFSGIMPGNYYAIDQSRDYNSSFMTTNSWNVALEDAVWLIGAQVGSNAVLSIPQSVSFTRNGINFILSWDAVPEADWYALYVSDEAYGDFYYAGWYDSSVTQLTGAFNPDFGNKLFFRVTAGTGEPPMRERTSDNRLFRLDFKPSQ